MKLTHHLKTLALAVGAATAVTVLTGAAKLPAASAVATTALAGPSTIATGAITSGSTPVVGAAVTGRLWPNQATLAAGKTGERLGELYAVGSTRTDASGRFRLALDPATVPALYRGEAGRVDVELTVVANGRSLSWNYTATRRGAADWSTTPADADGQPGPASLTIALGADSTATVREAHSRLTKTTTSKATAAATRASDPCPVYWGDWHYGKEEQFARAWAWSGALATVNQANGIDHTLGIAVNSTGSWAQGGASTVNMAGASASRGGVADSWVWNKVNYRDLHSYCTTTHRRPISLYAFLTKWTYAGHPYWSSCVTYTGGNYNKHSGTNVTYYGGVNLGVISVSAQSGWNLQGNMTWVVRSPTKLCGSTRYGWVKSGEAEAHRG